MFKISPKLRIRPAGHLLAILAALVLVVALCGSALASQRPKAADVSPYSVTLTGNGAPNIIQIDYDGTQYTITANGSLAPAKTCVNPTGSQNELDCPAADINGFQVDAGGGNDTVTVGKSVPVSTILNGGAGLDDLVGGHNTDRISGGNGDDKLVGRMGPDQLLGGAGNDTLIGGSGKDTLVGGPGVDILRGGPDRDVEHQ